MKSYVYHHGVSLLPIFEIDSIIVRQIAVTFASCMLCSCIGMTVGISAVMLPQLKQDDSFPYDENYNSWIASIAPLTMTIGCIFAGYLLDKFGRKKCHIILTFPFLLGWLIIGFASNSQILLIGRIITGLCTGAIRPVSLIYIGEITHPKYRGIGLFCSPLSANLGVIYSHLLSKYVSWRTDAFLCCVTPVISLLALLLVKESPTWLISKGRTQEGIDNFNWYRGNSEEAKKELKSILEKQENKISNNTIKQVLNLMLTKNFLKPFLIVVLLQTVIQFSGSQTVVFYAQDILNNTFRGKVDSFALMIGIDCVRIMGSLSVCLFGKYLSRRKTLIASSFGIILALVLLIITLYINSSKLVWLSIILLILYIGMASMVSSLTWSLVAELFPVSLRGIGSGAGAAVFFALLFVSVEVTPTIMETLGIVALYCTYAAITFVCSVILIFLLPETNGRTLQDIEDNL